MDIFRANYETGLEAIYNVNTQELKESSISPEVFLAFQEERTVLRTLKMNPLDHLIGHLCLAFELVYTESRRLAAEQGYLQKLAEFESDNPDSQEKLRQIRRKFTETGLFKKS